MRPGYTVTASTVPPSPIPPDTGTWMAAGVTSQGPTGATPITSLQQYNQVFGQRGSNPLFTDCVETFFAEGGSQMYVARVVGPAATGANVLLKDVTNAASLGVFAIGPGAYANGYKIVVVGSAGNYTIQVQDSNTNVLETSPTLTSVADAVGYGQTSQQVQIVALGTVSPAAGTFTLASGADDLTHLVDSSYTNAVNAAFTADLGPAQVSVPGVSTVAVITGLFQHATAFGRVAVADLADFNMLLTGQTSAAVSTSLQAAATPITALSTTARAGGLFAPWADIAPISGTLALRSVPMSPFVAAKASLVDDQGNPNVPVAGNQGILETVVQLHATFADVDRQALNFAGVNITCKRGNRIKIYGNVTPVNRMTDPLYFQFANARLDMAISADAGAIEEEYVHSEIDGQGLDAAHYGNELTAMLTDYWDKGALFGNTAQEAFSVDTSGVVNTPLLESEGDLGAVIRVRRSPGAELVTLNIIRVPITQNV